MPELASLIDIARESAPFVATDGQAYVSVPVPPGGVFPVRSTAFRNWFYYRVYVKHDTIPSTNAYQGILNLLESQAAAWESNRVTVSRRIAGIGAGLVPDRVLLHLANQF